MKFARDHVHICKRVKDRPELRGVVAIVTVKISNDLGSSLKRISIFGFPKSSKAKVAYVTALQQHSSVPILPDFKYLNIVV